MTQNKRILLNVVATYGRSLFSLVVGLFTSRWTLQALGVESYGVYGVVGVIIGFVTMFNGMFASAIGRFYAYSIGRQNVSKNKSMALEECQAWFSVAVVIYLALPLLVLAVGLPGGIWAVRNYFVIPQQLVGTAHWILYFSLISVVIGLVTVPFSAMYVARQYIAELTIYQFITSSFYLLFSYWLLSYKGDRLLLHALFTMITTSVVPLIIAIRAYIIFPECRFRSSLIRDKAKFVQLFGFTGWQIFGWVGWISHKQGLITIVNKVLGIEYNSTMSIATVVNGHASTLGSAVTQAFTPAVTNAVGEGNEHRFISLTINNAKYGTALCAVFMLPLAVEINYVIGLWLKNPPPLVAGMCVLVMAASLIDHMTHPFLSAIVASGNIRIHEVLNGSLLILGLIISYVFVAIFGFGIYGVGYGSMVTFVIVGVLRLMLWKYQLKMAVRPWLSEFFIPFIISASIPVFLGYCITLVFNPSFIRLMLNGALVGCSYIFLSWMFLMTPDERIQVKGKVFARFRFWR